MIVIRDRSAKMKRSVLIVREAIALCLYRESGGFEWTRTIDLTLIRGVL